MIAGMQPARNALGTVQYDTRDFTGTTTYNFPATPDTTAFPGGWNDYFVNASVTGTAKRHDTYMLISPGPDRKFGTSDDICNFSF